jgi:hypothetical protein
MVRCVHILLRKVARMIKRLETPEQGRSCSSSPGMGERTRGEELQAARTDLDARSW